MNHVVDALDRDVAVPGVLRLQSWYLSGPAHPECLLPRTVHLHDPAEPIENALRRTWRDLQDPLLPMSAYVVRPAPPDDGFAVQLVPTRSRPAESPS